MRRSPHRAFFQKSASSARQRGFALLIVLWTLVLIGLLTTQLLATGRTAIVLAGNLRAAAQARAAADGAINEAVFHVLAFGPDHWPPDGAPHVITIGAITVTVQVETLTGMINPNLASTGLLAGLLQAVGAPPGQAAQLAAAITTWRSPAANPQDQQARLAAYQRAGLPYGPPGHPFAGLGELSNIINMPPALLAASLPHMSLYQPGDPDPLVADPQVRRALALSGQPGATPNQFNGTSPVVRIQALATGIAPLALQRTATVSIAGSNGPVPFTFLSLSGG